MGFRVDYANYIALALSIIVVFLCVGLFFKSLSYVNLSFLIIMFFFIVFGLTFGFFAGRLVSKYQLKGLNEKGYWRGTATFIVAQFAFFVFALFFLVLLVEKSGPLESTAFAVGEFFFVCVTLLIFVVIRTNLFASWERQTEKS